jgi:predicted PurR-regulated permease PerM
VATVKLGVGSKSILVMAALAIVLAALKLAKAIILPLLVAIFIAAATAPIVSWLKRRRIPPYLAVTLTIVAVLGGLTGFAILVMMAATDLAESLPLYERALRELKLQVATWLNGHHMVRSAATVIRFDVGAFGENVVKGVVFQAPVTLSAAGTVFFIVIFILLEAATFRNKVYLALDWNSDRFEDVRYTMGEVQKYLLVKTAVSVLTGLLCGLWAYAMGLRDAVLWGMVSFALNFIPVFGSVVATLATTGMAVLQGGLGVGLAVFGGFIVVNNAIGNLLEPKLLGRALGLSPLVIVVSIVVWGWLLGPIGALLSVPLMMVFKIIAANTADLRGVAVLLGSGEGRLEIKYAEERRRSRMTHPGARREAISRDDTSHPGVPLDEATHPAE